MNYNGKLIFWGPSMLHIMYHTFPRLKLQKCPPTMFTHTRIGRSAPSQRLSSCLQHPHPIILIEYHKAEKDTFHVFMMSGRGDALLHHPMKAKKGNAENKWSLSVQRRQLLHVDIMMFTWYIVLHNNVRQSFCTYVRHYDVVAWLQMFSRSFFPQFFYVVCQSFLFSTWHNQHVLLVNPSAFMEEYWGRG